MQVAIVLAQAKREGVGWDLAWLWAMRAFCPPRTCSRQLREALEEERELLHEVRPFWQAAYEGREVTGQEFEEALAHTERRLDSVLCSAA